MSVLVIYTGGTIGSIRKNPKNHEAPLIPGSEEDLKRSFPINDDDIVEYGKHEVKVKIKSFKNVIDSSMIKIPDWVHIAEIIDQEYANYEGFVILHGTDTMAYTAAVLTFMLENLSKPVILTGSQLPIAETRSDAVQNLVTAIAFAAPVTLGHKVIPEVCVCFNNVLLRGCRTTKIHADSYDGFGSPNYPPLATAGELLEINESLILPPSRQDLSVRYSINGHVIVFKMTPLMDYAILDRLLSIHGLEGVVLETYGAGNAPTDKKFLDIIESAVNRDIHVVDVTQCHAGTVQLGLYDVSAGLLERRVISGLDMVSEAAQAKLAVLLNDKRKIDETSELMQISLRGEMDANLFDIPMLQPDHELSIWNTVYTSPDFPAGGYYPDADERKEKVLAAKLRIMNLDAPDLEPDAEMEIEVYIDEDIDEHGKIRAQIEPYRVSGIVRDAVTGKVPPVFIDVTEDVQKKLDPNRKASVTVKSNIKVTWSDMHLAVFTKPKDTQI